MRSLVIVVLTALLSMPGFAQASATNRQIERGELKGRNNRGVCAEWWSLENRIRTMERGSEPEIVPGAIIAPECRASSEVRSDLRIQHDVYFRLGTAQQNVSGRGLLQRLRVVADRSVDDA